MSSTGLKSCACGPPSPKTAPARSVRGRWPSFATMSCVFVYSVAARSLEKISNSRELELPLSERHEITFQLLR
jgi:hypothetical protein